MTLNELFNSATDYNYHEYHNISFTVTSWGLVACHTEMLTKLYLLEEGVTTTWTGCLKDKGSF